MSERPTAAQRLAIADAVLSRSDLRDLGFGRQAIDRIFRACPVIELPGSRRPLIPVAAFRAYIEAYTFEPREERVR